MTRARLSKEGPGGEVAIFPLYEILVALLMEVVTQVDVRRSIVALPGIIPVVSRPVMADLADRSKH